MARFLIRASGLKLRSFVDDERGAIAVQVALILPIFIIILIGAFEVWKVLYVQQVLNDAAYQGVRLMVMQANSGEMDVPLATDKLIRRYVSQSPFIDPALRANPDDLNLLNVTLDYVPPKCDNPVVVEVRMQWIVGREWRLNPNPTSGWFPFLGRPGTLTGRARGVVLCERVKDVLNVR